MALIDPHSVFTNGENIDLADLTMFAELKVTKRNRITSTNSTESSIVINFLGQNNKGYFTTDYTENKENFGIVNIQYKMTSSYVPQVDITFKDVRGQSLFNDNINSKYKILFDMPPPIFELTLKGYYGQSVSHRLHLLKNNVTYNEGNFDIRSSFIGMTYAPISDMLFDYLEVAPFLSGVNTDDTDVNTTLELRTKAKDLIAEIKSASSKDVEYLQDKTSLLETLKEYENKDYVNDLLLKINSITVGNKGQNTEIICQRQDEILKIGYKWYGLEQKFADQDTYDILLEKLNNESKFLNDAGIKISFGRLKSDVSEFRVPDNVTSNQYIEIITIDLTGINQKITKARTDLATDITTKQYQTKDKVKSIVLREIKGGPTLRNVLKILLNDANTFVKELKKVVNNVATKRKNNNSSSTGEAYKYPFPIFYIDKSVGDDNRITKVKSIPTFEDWDEVQFVNRYINAKISAKSYEEANSTNFDSAKNETNNWIPINPFDSLISSPRPIYNSVNKNNLLETVIKRAYVISNATFEYTNGNISNFLDLVKIYGKLEAFNLINTLKTNPNLLNYLITTVSTSTFDFGEIDYELNNNRKSYVPVISVDGATPSVIYNGGDMIQIKDTKDWETIGGVPEERKNISGTDELTNLIQDLVKKIEDNFLERTLKGTDKVTMCQYNIPFFKDNKLKDNNGLFDDASDFINARFIFQFTQAPSLDDFSTTDDFLNLLFHNNFSNELISPFDMRRFRMVGAIHEVPMFALAYWGYKLKNINKLPSNEKQQWLTVPNKMVEILKSKYNDFDAWYMTYKNSIIPFLTTKMKRFNLDNIVDLRPPVDFYKESYMAKFSESFYLVLGETKVFSDEVDKTIDFTKNYNLVSAYFDSLKNTLKNNKVSIEQEQKEEQKQIDSKVKDNDLRTELYYSFKSFVDRWLLDSLAVDFDKLFDVDESFLMVDRAFNNIGDNVMLDLTPLYSTETSVDTSLYTLLINLLSKNNFEFFSLPTYVNYKDAGLLWSNANINKIFGTTNTINIDSNPKFICMYIGGTSAQLDMPKINDDSYSHENDGGNINDIKDLSDNNEIQAFVVNMGTGNQSFFKNIELDQAEFKETNESIKLLDRIANSADAHSSSTEVKSNNLYNVFQQRSYTAKVDSLGNMMIQPTMYFQLGNISMWKGSYLITEVTHDVSPNNFKTSFVGVRVPQFMKPYVDDYTIIANLDLGSPLSTSTSYSSSVISGGRGVSTSEIKDIKSALSQIGNNTNTKISPREKALLDVISFTEGTLGKGQNGYDILFSNKLIPVWTPNYVHGHGGEAWKNTSGSLTSTAAGRYQFLYDTWLGYSTGDGTTQGDLKNKPFSLSNQDLTGVRLIKEKRLNSYGLDIEKIDHDNFIKYIDVLALEWASFPFYGTIKVKSKSPNWSVGKGFYDGQGGKFTVDELWIVYSLALKKYNTNNPNGINLNDELNKLVATTVTPASAAHIATLHPSVQQKFLDLITTIQQQTGYQVNVTSSYRTYAQQMIENNKNSNNPNIKNAPAGKSLHEYGLACFSSDTEILTNNGWVHFSSLSKNEEVMVFKDDTIYYEKPLNYIKYKYEGEMINFKTKSIDILVTPNHKMVVKKEHYNGWDEKWSELNAELVDYKYKIPTSGKFINKNIVEYPYQNKIKAEDWWEFMGWYITEGYCCGTSDGIKRKHNSRFKVAICQNKNTLEWGKIEECIKRCGFKYNCGEREIYIHNKELHNILFELGNSYEKYIPRYLLNGNEKLLSILYETMLLGDGTHYKNRKSYWTVNKKLADNFFELCVLLNKSVVFDSRMNKEIMMPHGSKLKTFNMQYGVHVRNGKSQILRSSVGDKNKNITKVDYNDFVYCVETLSGAVVVRRNGKVFIAGNCDINLIRGGVTLLQSSPQSAWVNTGVVNIAKNLGFAWGGEFPNYADNVHFEVTNNGIRYSGNKLFEEAQQLFGSNITNSDLRKITLV